MQYNTLLYGKDNIRSKNILGTIASVETITIDDIKNYYIIIIFLLLLATMHVVGDIESRK